MYAKFNLEYEECGDSHQHEQAQIMKKAPELVTMQFYGGDNEEEV